MKPIPNIITGEYLVYESGEYLKKGQYIRCFKLLDKHVADPDLIKGKIQELQIQIQLIRRLLQSCNSLLQKYFRKISDKSHKLQPLLHRTIELCIYLSKYLSHYYDLSNGTNLQRSETPVCESPTVKRRQFYRQISQEHISLKSKLMQYSQYDLSQQFEQKSKYWFKNQCFNYYCILFSTILNVYRYHKYNRTQGCQLFLILANKVCEGSQYQGVKQQSICSTINLMIGNSYFELSEFQTAEQYFQMAIDKASTSILKIMDDIEKLRRNLEEKLLKKEICHLVCQILVGLEQLGMINEQIDHVHRSLEIYHLGQFLNKILGFFGKNKELSLYFQKQKILFYENYSDHVKETVEICKFLSEIYDISIYTQNQFDDDLLMNRIEDQFQYFQAVNYENMKKTGINNQLIFVRAKELPPKPQRHKQKLEQSDSQYYIKNASQTQKTIKIKQNSSIHSVDQPSTHYADSQIYASAKQDYSLSKIDTSMRSVTIKKSELTKTNKNNNENHRNSFLNDLINLRNQNQESVSKQVNKESEVEKAYRLQKELLYKISNQNVYVPLDKVVKSYIDKNLTHHQKCSTLSELKQNATQIVSAEQEVHKEVPITKSLLNARKITCSQGVIIKEQEKEFNKLLEFNALEYFDFVSSQKDQAVIQLKANQESQQVKLAQQSLFSQNLVPKKRLNFLDIEEQQKQLETNQLAQQAEQMLNRANTNRRRKSSCQQSRVSLLFNYMPEQTRPSTLKIDPKPQTQELAIESAKKTIKQFLFVNEKQKKQFEQEDEDLKETELPFKFKRSRTNQKKKHNSFKSILHRPELLQLSASTKNVRDREFTVIQDTRIKQWVQDRIK